DGLLRLLLGHPDLQERAGPARCGAKPAAGSSADRDGQPLSGPHPLSRQAQQPGLCAARGRRFGGAERRLRGRAGGADLGQLPALVRIAMKRALSALLLSAITLAHAAPVDDLTRAAELDNGQMVLKLLLQGVDPNAADVRGRTALLVALQEESDKALES